jgi:ubiquinone/menaquinone biosynthesis C-methylase UbiE
MDLREEDRAFGARIAEGYDTLLVPLLFEPYAVLVAERVAKLRPARVLELAAGTGALTRALSDRLPSTTAIVATDLNQAMLDRAIGIGTSRPVQWRQADALDLPFADASADVVVCQFGSMFFPDKPRAFAEARRVLSPGGTLFVTVWDTIETNELAAIVDAAVAAEFPDDPPSFMQRTPHGYGDPAVVAADLFAGGLEAPAVVETLTARSIAASARVVAEAFCEGTPLRSEIEARVGPDVSSVTRSAEIALAQRFGSGEIDAKMQAHLLSVVRS